MIGCRVHPAGQSVRAGARWHKQQQLRECSTDPGHCKADKSAGGVGWLGTCFREPQTARTATQEWHRFHRFVSEIFAYCDLSSV